MPILAVQTGIYTWILHGYGSWDEGKQSGGLTDITGIGALSNLVSLDLLAPDCSDISDLAYLKLEQIEFDLPEDCDLTPLKKIANLKKVVISNHFQSDDDKNGMLEKVRILLPDIEVLPK